MNRDVEATILLCPLAKCFGTVLNVAVRSGGSITFKAPDKKNLIELGDNEPQLSQTIVGHHLLMVVPMGETWLIYKLSVPPPSIDDGEPIDDESEVLESKTQPPDKEKDHGHHSAAT